MKVHIVISEGVKQLMLTPETDHEIEALSYITPEDKIDTVVKRGAFGSKETLYGADISMCMGGYMRAFPSDESVMFVLTPKTTEK